MCSDVSTKVEKLALLLLPLCCIEKCVLTFIPVNNGSEPASAYVVVEWLFYFVLHSNIIIRSCKEAVSHYYRLGNLMPK